MSIGDLPEEPGTADDSLTFEQGVEALEGIFDGPEKEPQESKVQNKEEEADALEEEDADDSEMSEEPEDDEESEDGDEEEEAEAESYDLTDETEIDLGDGQKATLAQLKADYGQVQKRVADFQRDYTQKTDALAQSRKEVEEQSQRVLQWANETRQQREMILAFQQKHMPQPPSREMMQEDPVGYMQAKADYDEAMQQMQQLQYVAHQEQQRQSAQQLEAEEKRLEQERAKMQEVLPELADPKKLAQFKEDVTNVFAKEYGFTMDEISTVRDHRFAKVMRDAIAYQKLQKSQPKIQAKVAGKPPVMRSGKSMAKSTSAKGKEQRLARLRSSGSLEAGIDALMDLDL